MDTPRQKILIAFDGSPPSEHALQEAIELARQGGHELLVAYVIPPLHLPPEVEGSWVGEAEQQHRAFGMHLTENAVAKARAAGVPAVAAVVYGEAADTLAGEAEDPSVKMAVIGSRGQGALKRALLGSVSSRLAHICIKPLLIVR